jgi:hypothetical protein
MYRTPDGSELTYEIKENGYTINRDGRPWISQPEPYAKLYVANGSYEDNAKAQCEELCKPSEPVPSEDKMDEVYSALDDLQSQVDELATGLDEVASTEESEVTNG